MLWSQKYLKKYCIETQPTMAVKAKEEAIQYGVRNSELTGVFASILGNIPDETMTFLLKQGLRKLAEMSPEELTKLPGISQEKALRLTASFDLARRMAGLMPDDKVSIWMPEDVAEMLMEEMCYLDKEHFVALLLNTKNQLIEKELISIGTLDSSIAKPREIFKLAIRRSAAGVVLVHNHPSGSCEPSGEDEKVTNRLVEASEIIGIPILDHIIIGYKKFVSFKVEGLI